jgi:hypothetical protein
MYHRLRSLRWFRKSDGTGSADVTVTWDRMRSQATTPSERAEIDAVFSRQV